MQLKDQFKGRMGSDLFSQRPMDEKTVLYCVGDVMNGSFEVDRSWKLMF